MDVSVHLHAPAALSPATSLPQPLNMKLGGRSVLFEVDKRLLPLHGIEPWFLGRSVHNLAAVLTADCPLETRDFRSAVHLACGNPYPTAFPYGNGMVLHFYQQQESSTTKTVHKVINKGLKTYV